MRKSSKRVIPFIVGLIILGALAVIFWQSESSKSGSAVVYSETINTSPTPQSLPTRVKFKVNLPQKAFTNSNVTVSVEAQPGTNCGITYVAPTGETNEAEGLGDTMANENGMCTWTWRIGEVKQKGAGRVIISIGGISETHFIEIRPGE
jgi:hypothetical protein